jgi:hypothetical protein
MNTAAKHRITPKAPETHPADAELIAGFINAHPFTLKHRET